MRIFSALVLRRPWLPIALVLLFAVGFGRLVPRFGIDASSESLLLENDPSLVLYDRSHLIFGSDDYVMVAFSPGDPFSDEAIRHTELLSEKFLELPGVDSVLSLTEIPLLKSPPNKLALSLALAVAGRELPEPTGGRAGVRVSRAERLRLRRELHKRSPFPLFLSSPNCDRKLAREEILHHALYRKNLISADGKTVSLLVYFEADPELIPLQHEVFDDEADLAALERGEEGVYRRLSGVQEGRALPAEELAAGCARLARERAPALAAKRARYQELDQARRQRRETLVGACREVLKAHPYPGEVPYFTSGVPVVISDIGAYISHDMRVFGLGVAAAFVAILWFVLRRLRWVALPLATCAVTVVVVLGAMVACDRKITIPTSNLSSLLFIIAMVHSIQLLVVYGESQLHHPERSNPEHILHTCRDLLKPCLFTSVAMIAGFGSLLLSDIRSIWDFGIFMSLGVGVSFVVSFLLIPAGLALLPPAPLFADARRETPAPVRWLARATQAHRGWILAGSLAVIVLSVWGTFRIDVETKFIDYFRASTSFYQGMSFIDRNLGGTITLEVVLDGKKPDYFAKEANLDKVRKIQAFLEAKPEVGKVMTVTNLVDELRGVVAAAGLSSAPGPKALAAKPALRVLRNTLGKDNLRSYVTEDRSSVRIFARMLETYPRLERRRIINELEAYLAGPDFADLEKDQRVLTGLFVLYTDMIESLITSQIWIVLAGFGLILATICLLFRSWRVGLIGVIPNVMHILFILGAMGWLGINLDMITIMIASVSMGISVDCAIHYLCRYRLELSRDGDYDAAMVRTHATTGTAIWDTSVAIIVGFCVLALSNFRPTISFGVLTALAMASALFSSLTLVPLAVLYFRPRLARSPAASAVLPGLAAAASTGPGAHGAAGGTPAQAPTVLCPPPSAPPALEAPAPPTPAP
ncbi:MAG: MMPL family transporter [Planctomycetes bacterium]|nr:MMPL family transporter [Planctomycetota bacterium]